MNALWVVLAVLAAFGLLMLIGNYLIKNSMAHQGLCPVCFGEGGPCKACNGLGVIVEPSKNQASECQESEAVKKGEKKRAQ